MTDASLAVSPARPEEWETVLQIIFQASSFEDRQTRTHNALNLLRQGELDARCVLVVRDDTRLLGAMICQPTPGASALVWPPATVADCPREVVEDRLLVYALGWLRQQGVKIVQTLLLPEESELADALLRHDFTHVTSLWYMRHELARIESCAERPECFSFQMYKTGNHDGFRQTLEQTYQGTQDCPEINGVRELDEVLEGHQAQGVHDPERWWLALENGRPVGVLMLAVMPEWDSFDISYLGVVPEARGRGVGKALAGKALCEARRAGARLVTLAVDARNRPAWKMYLGLGFEAYDRREVYLAIWKRTANREFCSV
jgi:ribosomal protein S18 acetylase RimI-like enzyme